MQLAQFSRAAHRATAAHSAPSRKKPRREPTTKDVRTGANSLKFTDGLDGRRRRATKGTTPRATRYLPPDDARAQVERQEKAIEEEEQEVHTRRKLEEEALPDLQRAAHISAECVQLRTEKEEREIVDEVGDASAASASAKNVSRFGKGATRAGKRKGKDKEEPRAKSGARGASASIAVR